MVQLDLTQEEAGRLVQILDANLSSLRFEIGDTDNAEFRKVLKQNEHLIKDLLARLSVSQSSSFVPGRGR